jgi:hypothetical protein
MSIGRVRKGRNGRLRVAAALVLGLLVATAVNALVASNTVPSTAAGSGSGTISGYTVTSPAYTLNATNPANIDAVTFTLSAAATTVKAKLVSSSTSYYSCTNTANNDWSCATTSPQATVATANELSVVSVA